ncbi:MAG: 50S ribosomal protein L10 [Candidatus Geothermincolia bacterium]
MPKPEKIRKVEELRSKFEPRSAVLVTEYRGLTVDEMAALRAELRGREVEYRVLKNTITKLAIEGTPFEPLGELLTGPVALAFVDGEAPAAAKSLMDFARSHPSLKLKGGVLEGRLFGAAQMKSLATLPPREILQARLAGSMKSPMARLHGALSSPLRGLVYALKAVADEKEKAA